MNGIKHDWWDEGEYVDLWSFVHFLAGMMAGLVSVFFDISFILALCTFFAVALAWEIAEFQSGIVESKKNIALDVLIAIGGFGLTPLVVFSGYVDPAFIHVFFGVVVASFFLLSIRGWFAYRKREGKKRLRDIVRQI